MLSPSIPPKVSARCPPLCSVTIEMTFTDCVTDPKEVILLGGIDIPPDKTGFRVRSHEFHGPLLEVIVQVDAADRLGALGRLGSEAVNLCTISRLRRELEEAFSGSSFLPPTTMDSKCVAGLQWHGRTVLAEAADLVQAY
jgi:hypothetical protein